MLLVLDSNEYIFAFGAEGKRVCIKLLQLIVQDVGKFRVRVPRTTVEDVREHESRQGFREFLGYLNALNIHIDEDNLVPYQFGGKYMLRGLKPGDAFLAGYAEWVNTKYLISENRKDFVDHPELFPFNVRTAEKFLKEFPDSFEIE